MATAGRGATRLAVRIDPTVWDEEVGRLAQGAPGRVAAERERPGLARDGIELISLMACEPLGTDATRLGGLVKAYVPIGDRPASERPCERQRARRPVTLVTPHGPGHGDR